MNETDVGSSSGEKIGKKSRGIFTHLLTKTLFALFTSLLNYSIYYHKNQGPWKSFSGIILLVLSGYQTWWSWEAGPNVFFWLNEFFMNHYWNKDMLLQPKMAQISGRKENQNQFLNHHTRGSTLTLERASCWTTEFVVSSRMAVWSSFSSSCPDSIRDHSMSITLSAADCCHKNQQDSMSDDISITFSESLVIEKCKLGTLLP